jgi:hypothetical protein
MDFSKESLEEICRKLEEQTKKADRRCTSSIAYTDEDTKELIKEFKRQEFNKELSNRINYKLMINFRQGKYSL